MEDYISEVDVDEGFDELPTDVSETDESRAFLDDDWDSEDGIQPEEEFEDEAEPTDDTVEDDEADQPTVEDGEFELKHLDETRKVNKDEVIELAQKGLDYDRIRQDRDAQRNENSRLMQYEKFLQKLADESGQSIHDVMVGTEAKRLMAKANARGEEMSEVDAWRQAEKLLDPNYNPNEPTKGRRSKDFDAFAKRYPDVKPQDIPQDVWQAYARGEGTLSQLYSDVESRNLRAEVAELKKKVSTYEQNDKNSKRAPGSMKTSAKSTRTDLDRLWYDEDD